MEETIKEIEEESLLTNNKEFIPLVDGTTIN